jgi:hypothetical protein
MYRTIYLFLSLLILSACANNKISEKKAFVIDRGQVPNVIIDKQHIVHLLYGRGDSILYCFSSDNGTTFSHPALVAVISHLYSFAMRGPQITATKNNLIVTAGTTPGTIHAFCKKKDSLWETAGQVNDRDTVAKEGLMALDSDGDMAYAVWLDVRGNRRNKIYGAKSTDGGKTWSKNILVYASPDSNVCECCKPSIRVKGTNVYVMFRNQLNGNRDMYLSHSSDGGNSFAATQKLGNGNWKLNACPMDGGGLAVNNEGVQTVWRREATIYASGASGPETEIGKGRQCTLEMVNGKRIYAWIEKDSIVIQNQQGKKKIVGRGSIPVLKALDSSHVFCVWENDKHIYASVVAL